MHINRSLYTLEEYQNKLILQSKSMRLLLLDKKSGDTFYFKPSIKSIWVKEFRKEYLRERSDRLRVRVSKGDLAFVTLTYWTKLYTPEQVADRHKKDINKFIKTLRKIYPPLDYMYVVEVTKRNYVHFHLFMSKVISKGTIKSLWKSITGTYITKKIDITDPRKASNYITKYVTKYDASEEEKLPFMWNYIDRFFASARKFFKKATDNGSGSKYALIAMLFGDLDIVEMADSLCNSAGFVTSSDFYAGLATTDRLLKFNITSNGFVFANNPSFKDDNEKFNFYDRIIGDCESNFNNAFDLGIGCEVFED